MARVLVVTPDALPRGGRPATGAGLRAWGLGEGLRSRGHRVSYAMPSGLADGRERVAEDVLPYEPERLDELLAEYDPDVAVFQHWPMAALVERYRGYVVIDFHGPLLLETLFRDPPSVEKLLPGKLRALARADYFTCAGAKQLSYFASYLLIAGFDVRELPIAVVPFSMPPELPEGRAYPSPPVFVYGGVFLPWQNPVTGFRVLVRELEEAAAGELRLFGGRHPWLEVGSERFEELKAELEASPRVRAYPALGRSELLDEYAGASVAWDLMARNVERELAFTSRTVEYLWCGLPVVYNDYAELAGYIEEADAGWTVDPEDEERIRAIVRDILADPEMVRRKGENARRLARSRLAWDRTIAPLDEFCRNPRRPARLDDAPLVNRPIRVLPALRAELTAAAVGLVASATRPLRTVIRRTYRLAAARR